MFPSSYTASRDIWTPVLWGPSGKLNLIFGSVYFCLFVMWRHICVCLPGLFIEWALQQSWGASCRDSSWCKDWHMGVGFNVFVFLCPFLHLSTRAFTHLGFISLKAPDCVFSSSSTHLNPLCCLASCLSLLFSHTSSPVRPLARPTHLQDWYHAAKKMLISAKWEGCFRRKGNPSPTLRGLCVNVVSQISASCPPQAKTHQTPCPWCRSVSADRWTHSGIAQLLSANSAEETTRRRVSPCHQINTVWHALIVCWLDPQTVNSSHAQM